MPCSMCQDEALLDMECNLVACPSCNQKHPVAKQAGQPFVELSSEERKRMEAHRLPASEVASFLHKSGLLFEINRRLLHPLGMALSVVMEDDGRISAIGPMWDYRDDPEGMLFDSSTFAASQAKFKAFLEAEDVDRKLIERSERLGFVIQED